MSSKLTQFVPKKAVLLMSLAISAPWVNVFAQATDARSGVCEDSACSPRTISLTSFQNSSSSGTTVSSSGSSNNNNGNACSPTTETRNDDCQDPSMIGYKTLQRNYTCSNGSGSWSGWAEVYNDCRINPSTPSPVPTPLPDPIPTPTPTPGPVQSCFPGSTPNGPEACEAGFSGTRTRDTITSCPSGIYGPPQTSYSNYDNSNCVAAVPSTPPTLPVAACPSGATQTGNECTINFQTSMSYPNWQALADRSLIDSWVAQGWTDTYRVKWVRIDFRMARMYYAATAK
jgi:hypothetical protein